MYADRLRRLQVADNEVPRLALRYLIRNESIPVKTRMLAQFKIGDMPAVQSEHRLSRRCVSTGRGKSIIREFNLSRILFREYALAGLLPGVVKASW